MSANYCNPIRGDGGSATEHEEINVDNVEKFTNTDSDHVPIAAFYAKYHAMLRRISELETHVLMFEAALDETKVEARKWNTNATNLRKMNDGLENELIGYVGSQLLVRPNAQAKPVCKWNMMI